MSSKKTNVTATNPNAAAPGTPVNPALSKDDLLLILASREEAITKAEEAVVKVRADYAAKLEPYVGMKVRHNGSIHKVVKNAKGSFSLKDLESKDLKSALAEGL